MTAKFLPATLSEIQAEISGHNITYKLTITINR